ncbi:MAG: SIMPL domain-containing protein [Caldilineaceae bacterium]|nr:SIMPL domain-containing protein [Caldilineaceae bacterium]
MNRILINAFIVLACLFAPVNGYAAPAPDEDVDGRTVVDGRPGITVTGYGYASAPPDAARVYLTLGSQPGFPGVGNDTLFFGPEKVEDVRNLLLERGIREETVETKHLVYSLFAPTNPTSEISFVHDDPGGLQAFLQELQQALQGQQAPALLSTQVTFIVEDCYALEEEAILDAFADARMRAGRLARLLGLSLGEEVIAVSEEMSANQCRASALADFISRAAFPLENNVAEVEAGSMLRVSFALER